MALIKTALLQINYLEETSEIFILSFPCKRKSIGFILGPRFCEKEQIPKENTCSVGKKLDEIREKTSEGNTIGGFNLHTKSLFQSCV